MTETSVVAYHEAGHAVIYACVGYEVRTVSIQETEYFGGYTLYRKPSLETINDWASVGPNHIAAICAGPVAESVYTGEEVPLFEGDIESIVETAEHFGLSRAERKTLIIRVCDLLREFFARPEVWRSVVNLAEVLLAQTTIQGDRVTEIIGAGQLREICPDFKGKL